MTQRSGKPIAPLPTVYVTPSAYTTLLELNLYRSYCRVCILPRISARPYTRPNRVGHLSKSIVDGLKVDVYILSFGMIYLESLTRFVQAYGSC